MDSIHNGTQWFHWGPAAADIHGCQDTTDVNGPDVRLNNPPFSFLDKAPPYPGIASGCVDRERDQYIENIVGQERDGYVNREMLIGREEFATTCVEELGNLPTAQSTGQLEQCRALAYATWDHSAAPKSQYWRDTYETALRASAGNEWDRKHAPGKAALYYGAAQPGARATASILRSQLPVHATGISSHPSSTYFRQAYLPARKERAEAKRALRDFRYREAVKRADASRAAGSGSQQRSGLQLIPATRRNSVEMLFKQGVEAEPDSSRRSSSYLQLRRKFLAQIEELNQKPGREAIISKNALDLFVLRVGNARCVQSAPYLKVLNPTMAFSDTNVEGKELSRKFQERLIAMAEAPRVDLVKRLIRLISKAFDADRHPLEKESYNEFLAEFQKFKQESNTNEVDLPFAFWLYRSEIKTLYKTPAKNAGRKLRSNPSLGDGASGPDGPNP